MSEPGDKKSHVENDEAEDSIHRIDTVPPPGEDEDLYSAGTIVRDAPSDVIAALKAAKQTQSSSEHKAVTPPPVPQKNVSSSGIPKAPLLPSKPPVPSKKPPVPRANVTTSSSDLKAVSGSTPAAGVSFIPSDALPSEARMVPNASPSSNPSGSNPPSGPVSVPQYTSVPPSAGMDENGLPILDLAVGTRSSSEKVDGALFVDAESSESYSQNLEPLLAQGDIVAPNQNGQSKLRLPLIYLLVVIGVACFAIATLTGQSALIGVGIIVSLAAAAIYFISRA